MASGLSRRVGLSHDYDIIIIGGGIAGLTFANLLVPQNLFRIAIVDSASFLQTDIKTQTHVTQNWKNEALLDGWVSTLTPNARRILESIQVWQHLPTQAINPFNQIKVWDAHGTYLQLGETPIHQALGYVVNNTQLQQTLLNQLKDHPGVTRFSPNRLINLTSQSEQVIIQLDNQKTLTAQLLVGADGAQSTVKTLSGLITPQHDYQQTSLVTAIRHAIPHTAIARQIFLKTGPLALLPMVDPHHCAIVWTTTAQQAELLKTLPSLDFCQQLYHATHGRAGEIQAVGARLSFPLYRHHSTNYIKPHIALIGDAAHCIHPLAGQGANMGIADSACLAQTITATARKHRKIGTDFNLKPYERARRLRNQLLMQSIDGLGHLFSQQAPYATRLRRFGLKHLQRCTFLKRRLIQFASN